MHFSSIFTRRSSLSPIKELLLIVSATLLITSIFAVEGRKAEALTPTCNPPSSFFETTYIESLQSYSTFPTLQLAFLYTCAFDKMASTPAMFLTREEDLMKFWRLPETSRLEVEAVGDPIPDYIPESEVFYVLKRDETVDDVAKKFQVPLAYLEDINPNVDLMSLTEGDSVRAWVRTPGGSSSRGAANRGRLINGEPLRGTEALFVRHANRAFGTQLTVAIIQSAIDDFHRQFPETLPLMVGDISRRTGRRIRPHKSHQSGRDADISYPQRVEGKDFVGFVRATRKSFEVEKTFWLLKRLIDTGFVEYIFVDRRLQRQLVKYAKEVGAPPEWISAVFQYRGRRNSVVRHARGHLNHFHLRVRCHIEDTECRDSYTRLRRQEAIEERDHIIEESESESTLYVGDVAD